MKEKSFLNEILSPKLLAIAWGFIIVFCLFICFSMRGKCASQSSGVIPYNVAVMSNYNQIMLDKLEIALNKYYEVTGYNSEAPILVWTNDGFFRNSFYEYYIMLEPQLRSGYSYNDDYDFTSNKIYFSSSYQIVRIVVRTDNLPPEVQLNQGIYATLCGNVQSVSTSIGSFLPLYPFYYNGEPLIDETYNTEVLISRVNGQAPSGSATQPDLTGDNIGNDKPDIDDYLPNIPSMPSLDNSSLEKIAESIYNILQWGFNAIKGTLTGLFEYLGDLLSYSFQKVIDNIKNAIKNLYDNFESLFSPLLNGIADLLNSISQKIDYISQPLDSEALQEAFNDTALMDDFDSISQTVDVAFMPFTSTEEPDSFKIPLHTEQIPLINNTMLTSTVQYIDLGVINPVKSYIRGVMWALTTFGMLYTIIDSIPSYLQGNDE